VADGWKSKETKGGRQKKVACGEKRALHAAKSDAARGSGISKGAFFFEFLRRCNVFSTKDIEKENYQFFEHIAF
jgi:hypothetical protein